MGQNAVLPYVTDWRNFYMLIGTAAATLIGLMFVVTTLLSGMNKHISTLNVGISAFMSPTVGHFCAVLLACGILNMPWQTLFSVSLVLSLLGLGGVVYLIIVAQQIRHTPRRKTPLKDWLWYMVFPLIAYIVFMAAAFILPKNLGLILYFVSVATLMLLFIGIRNAWDLVTYLVIERLHPGNK